MKYNFASIFFLIVLMPLNVSAAETVFENITSVQWLGTPLRESLERFCEAQRIHFFLDRRIDPSQPVYLELTNQTIRQVFDSLAEKTETGCFFLEDTSASVNTQTVYIGTKKSAELLPLLLDKHRKEAAAMTNRQKNMLNKKTVFHLPFLGEPKQAIIELIKNRGFSLSSPQNSGTEADILPFDLWNKTDLPALPFEQLLTLLLIGFEKDYEINGNAIRIIPLPDISPSGNAAKETVKTQAASSPPEIPPSKVSPSGIPLSRRRFTLKVENQPLGAVLDIVSKRLGLTVETDRESLKKKNVVLEDLISFEVKNATVSELFREICKPLKTEYRIHGETVIIK